MILKENKFHLKQKWNINISAYNKSNMDGNLSIIIL